jgi:hypothetical protein
MMPQTARDTAFATYATDQRQRLLGVAFLVVGDPQRAEEIVQAALAQLYQVWAGLADPAAAALSRVVDARPGQLIIRPWQRGERFELIDGSSLFSMPAGIVADLSALTLQQRQVIVLEQFAQVPTTQIAALIGTSADRVHILALEARAMLCAADPSRSGDRVLAKQMTDSLPDALSWAAAPDAAMDLAHGRMLVRRRLLRSALLTAAVVLAVVLGITQLVVAVQPDQKSGDRAPRGPVPGPTCNPAQLSCQTGLARDWRAQMTIVGDSYVDPQHSYFSGYSYSYDKLYDSGSFWAGKGGVLGLDLFRLNDGATEVYLQIATSQRFAIPCGKKTHQHCISMEFMDGNQFVVTDTTDVSRGIEVQYSPRGTEVVTVVARDVSRGEKLNIQRGQLISLVQDSRLRLPSL